MLSKKNKLSLEITLKYNKAMKNKIEQEYEIVEHPYIKYVNLFMAQIGYRTPHLHSDMELMFIARGDVSYSTIKKTESFKPGDFIIMNSNEVHEIINQGEDTLMICLQVSPKYFRQIYPGMEKLKFQDMNVGKYFKDDELEEFNNIFLTLAQTYYSREEGYELKCGEFICGIFWGLLKNIPHHFLSEEEKRNSYVKAERLNRILNYMEEHFAEKIGLQDIAKAEKLSVSFLSHFITENLNQTFQEYLGGLRLKRAMELMIDSDMKLIDICVASGFSDYRYLNQAFIKRFDCTPKEYRMTYKPPADLKRISNGSMERIYTEEETMSFLKKGI